MGGPVDLAVVGFGPVGATLAGLAARAGLDVVAVDRETGLFPLPRAAHCDHEILRILQELGCADELAPTLRDNSGRIINHLQYDLTFYHDANKENGGWSMEMIDALNPCGGAANWQLGRGASCRCKQ